MITTAIDSQITTTVTKLPPATAVAATPRASEPSGSTSSSPNKLAIAPAVWRISQPSETPSRPTTVRYSPTPDTARSTPGADSVVSMCWLPRNAWPPKNAANALISLTTNETTANTTAFAPSTGSRVGTAENVERIEPVPYSPDTTSTPSTPMMSCARK